VIGGGQGLRVNLEKIRFQPPDILGIFLVRHVLSYLAPRKCKEECAKLFNSRIHESRWHASLKVDFDYTTTRTLVNAKVGRAIAIR
jgi:hypothetical protein